MATTQVALALVVTTLIVIALLTWATIYYVPLVLSEDERADESHGSGGRPS